MDEEVELSWEHKSVSHRSADLLDVQMDELAAERWTLVSVVFHPEGKFYAFLRRRIVQ